jgi:hypothetical protein
MRADTHPLRRPESPSLKEESSLSVQVPDKSPSRAEVAVEEITVQPPAHRVVPPPPVAPQPSAAIYASQLQSEKVVVAAPMSFAGSAGRIWKLVSLRPDPWTRVLLGVLAIALIVLAWTVVLAWYLFWGIWLVPYRLIRRGGRKRELIAAVQDKRSERPD